MLQASPNPDPNPNLEAGSLTLSRDPNQTKAPLAVLLPHSRRAEAAQLRQDGAAACLTRPLVAEQVAVVVVIRAFCYSRKRDWR